MTPLERLLAIVEAFLRRRATIGQLRQAAKEAREQLGKEKRK